MASRGCRLGCPVPTDHDSKNLPIPPVQSLRTDHSGRYVKGDVMRRILTGVGKVALVVGVGAAGLVGGSAHAADPEPAHALLCGFVGDCGR